MIAVIICGLAGWRVAVLLVREDGPFDIMRRFRHVAGIQDTSAGRMVKRNVLAQLLSCVWCTSVWTTTLAYGVYDGLDVRWPVQLVAACALPVVLDIYARRVA